MSNEILFGTEARRGMLLGIKEVAQSVGVTLGPGGRIVFINKQGLPLDATKDGISVAGSITFKDQIKESGGKMVKEASQKTASDIGDGTSATAILVYEICYRGLKLIEAGANPMQVKAGMEKALAAIVAHINKVKKDAGTDKKLLTQIATVSANNDTELGDLIGKTFSVIGKYGNIFIEDGDTDETTIDIVEGYQFPCGYFSHHFITTQKNTVELINPFVLIVEGKIEKSKDILHILEIASQKRRPILIIADDFDYSVVRTILSNPDVLKGSCIKYDFSGETKEEIMYDLCAVTGATLISDRLGKKLESVTMSDLGQCEKIISDKKETTVMNGVNNKDAIAKRIQDAKTKAGSSKNPFLKEKYEQRLAKLNGGIAICYVGNSTGVAIKEKKDRIDDAIKATKAAMLGGIVPGGGTILLRCITEIEKLQWSSEDERSGIILIKKAIEKPMWQICENAGEKGDYLTEKVKEKKENFGYNAKTRKIEDLVKAGIIDPAKVVVACIENAVSTAGIFLISSCLITDEIV